MVHNELTQKRLDFLNETIAFYTSENRCMNDNHSCFYFMEGKAGCAIGRHIVDKELCKKFDSLAPSNGVHRANIFNSLPETLKELGSDFLDAMQNLHDKTNNWTLMGLSDVGLEKVEKIKKDYNLV